MARALKIGSLHLSLIYNQENGQKIGALRTKDLPENHHFSFFCLFGKKQMTPKIEILFDLSGNQMFGRDQQQRKCLAETNNAT